MQVVLLAGGFGTRLREETEFRPKPMVEVGGHPVLWHIMKNFSHFGHNEFIIATGYKSDFIKDYFLHYETRNNDFTIDLNSNGELVVHKDSSESWKVTISDSGLNTPTGGRLLAASKYLKPNSDFLVTYGDGLADVNINTLIAHHLNAGKLATVTVVQPSSRFGVVDLNESNEVVQFREKPQVQGWINVGFFVMNQAVLNHLDPNEPLEHRPLVQLAERNELSAFRHLGFWQPMDTFREAQLLNELWNSGKPPWKTW